jgi:hypothetical protein
LMCLTLRAKFGYLADSLSWRRRQCIGDFAMVLDEGA